MSRFSQRWGHGVRPKLGRTILGILFAPAVLYVGFRAGLFVVQRQIIFLPSSIRLAGPQRG
jgi:hypothetical protein